MARKRQSAVRQAYMKERRRLQAFQRNAEKRGYIFAEPLVPKEIPNRITKKMVQELAYQTPSRIYAKSTNEYVDQVSGVIIPARVARQAEYLKRNIRRTNVQKFTKTRNKWINQYGYDIADFTEIPETMRNAMDEEYAKMYEPSQEPETFSMFPQYDFGEYTQEFDPSRYKNLQIKETPVSPDDENFIPEYGKATDEQLKQHDVAGLNQFNAFMQDMKLFPEEFFNKLVSYVNPIIEKYSKEEFGRAILDADINIYEYLVSEYDSDQAFSSFGTAIINEIPYLDDDQRSELNRIADEEQMGADI